MEVEGKVEADCLYFLSPDSALDIRPADLHLNLALTS